MTGKYSIDFLEAAKEIADEIILNSIVTENGIYWQYLDFTGTKKISYNLYDGNSGTLLFLIELYKLTKDRKYFLIIENGIKFLTYTLLESNSTIPVVSNLSFYSGLGGVIHTIIEFYYVSTEDKYLEIAVGIYKKYESNCALDSDILGGTAGEILTLLKIYSVKEEENVFSAIINKIKYLLNKAIVTDHGICWHKTVNNIHPLCGFAHGASGIAFVFLQLYKITGDEVFLYIVKNAFQYEDSYYNIQENNWPDFRKDILFTNEDLLKAKARYKAGDFKFFLEPRYWSGWCHGAPGIGMSRLYSYSLTGCSTDYTSFNFAIKDLDQLYKHQILPQGSYTICHGVLGNAHLYIDAYVINKDEHYLKDAIVLGYKSIYYKNKVGYYKTGYPALDVPADSGLFMGLAGIGHYYLRVIDPNIKSVLLPDIDFDLNKKVKIDCDFINILFQATFPFVSTFNENKRMNVSFKSSFKNQLLNIARDITTSNGNENLLELDMFINDTLNQTDSDVLSYVKDICDAERIHPNNTEDLLLSLNDKVLMLEKNDTYLLSHLDYSAKGYTMYSLGKFIYKILNGYRNSPTSVNEQLAILKKDCLSFEIQSDVFDSIYMENINKCIQLRFLKIIN